MTKTNAQEKLAALVAASKQFDGFTLGGSLQREIKNLLALTGAKEAEGARRAAAAEKRLRGNLAGFFAGSPRYFRGQLFELRRAMIDADLIVQVEAVLAKFAAVAARPVTDFAGAAKQHAAMAGVFVWARREQAARRAAAEKAVRERQLAARRVEHDFWAAKLAAIRQREAAAA